MPAPEENLAHAKWECTYHVVSIPKFRRRSLFELLKRDLGRVFNELTCQKECWIEKGHLMSDNVHRSIESAARVRCAICRL